MNQNKQTNNRKPWGMQKELQKGDNIPTPNDILDTTYKIRNYRSRALYVLTYLTAGRISELIRYQFYKDKKNIHPSIRRKEINFTEKHGRDVMLINIRNEKSNKRKVKTIPIPMDSDFHKKLINSIMPYLQEKELDEELFPFKYQYAYQKILKPICNPHWLRHVRLTHLVTYHGFSDLLLQRYAGWTDTRPAGIYSELRWGDILDKY